MYAGVPSAMLATLASESSSFFVPAKDFTSPKSSTFTKSCRRPTRPRWDVGGLDVPVHQPGVMGFLERLTDLAENVDDARRGERPSRLHERVEIDPLQQLHHQIEPALLRSRRSRRAAPCEAT